MKDLPTAVVECSEIRVVCLERVRIHLHTQSHPLHEGIIRDIVQGREVVDILQLKETTHPFTTSSSNAQLPSTSCRAIRSCRVFKFRAQLIRQVCLTTLQILQTVEDRLGNSDALGAHGTVLRWCCGCGLSLGFVSKA
jgi:hypothetical protein